MQNKKCNVDPLFSEDNYILRMCLLPGQQTETVQCRVPQKHCWIKIRVLLFSFKMCFCLSPVEETPVLSGKLFSLPVCLFEISVSGFFLAFVAVYLC